MIIVRIYTTNIIKTGYEKSSYSMNEKVLFEDDYFDSASTICNGYSVSVVSSEIMTVDELKKLYNLEEDKEDDSNEFLHVITVEVYNDDNDAGEYAGVNFNSFILQNNAYITFLNEDLYTQLNTPDYTCFSLCKGTSMEYLIPFYIDQSHISIEKYKSGNAQLVVSLFPNKKVITLW